MLWEMERWLDLYVKPPVTEVPATKAGIKPARGDRGARGVSYGR